MGRTGATILVEALLARGVRHLFTVSGNHVLSIYDATIGRGIQLIHTRHEANAVHMADAWGRLTGEPGVALVTGGPGHLNAVSALYGARMAESPVILLSGHAPRRELGRGAFQEVDQVGTARPVTKAAWLAEAPESLDRDVEAAWTLAATGRPGPVHLSLPTDVLEHAPRPPLAPSPRRPGEGGEGRPSRSAPAASPRLESSPADDAQLREVAARLAAAARPLALAGPAAGRGERWRCVRRLAEVSGIPALAMESPRGVNDPALRAAARCLGRADVVLLLGKRLDFSLRFGEAPPFAPDCRFLQVDWEAESAPGRVELALPLDPADAAARLAELAAGSTPSRAAWADEVGRAARETPRAGDELGRSARTPIHPLRVCAALQPFLDRGGILVSDGGEFGQWAQAGLRAGTRLINGPSGSIGSALPMGLAARLCHPDRTVLVTLGDGTFGYGALELDTALRYGLPVVAVVGNDARWNAEYQLQLRQYGAGRAVGCELLPTRYDRLVEALGGHGELVEHAADLTPALERAIASGRPACVNVLIEGAPAPTFPAA